MRIPATARVHDIPAELPLEDAAIIEPLACAIHAVNRGDVQLDDVVVIAGAGPIGLMMVQVASSRRHEAGRDRPRPKRRELALRFGADVAIDPTNRTRKRSFAG